MYKYNSSSLINNLPYKLFPVSIGFSIAPVSCLNLHMAFFGQVALLCLVLSNFKHLLKTPKDFFFGNWS